MDALKKMFRQFRGLYTSMTASQRMTLIVVPVMVLAAFAFLLFGDQSSSYVALSWGKVYTSEELMRAEQTLMDAGLSEFRRVGQRLMVPKGDVDQYDAALVEGGSLPNRWPEELEKSLADGGLFQSKAQFQAKLDIVLGRELARVLRKLPGIEEASVKWARSNPGRWRRTGSKVTALVSVRPRGGHELSMRNIQSLRYAAAAMVPDLQPKYVTVLNQRTGDAYTADDEDSPYNDRSLQKARDYAHDFERQIRNALSYIPGVLVTVNVDLDNLKRSIERKRTVDAKPVIVNETVQTKLITSSDQSTPAEPGAGPNQPRQLSTQAGNQQTQKTDESNTKTISLPSVTVTETEMNALMPESVQVAISIPLAYVRTVALAGKPSPEDAATSGDESQTTVTPAELEQAETDIKQRLQPQVMKLIPIKSAADAVDISFHIPGEPDVETVQVSFIDTASATAGRWGGAIGLALFALWALWMLNKSMSRLPAAEEEGHDLAGIALAPQTSLTNAEDNQELEEPEATQRDKLQSVVRDDPEMAAAVLSKWLQITTTT
jgi:flagellar M-ring protein FliF